MIKRNLYKLTTVICLLLLAASTIFVLSQWQQIPDKIPVHYNFAGEADGYGGKGSLVLMMFMAWAVFVIMTVSVRYPEKWNMPVKVTEENRSRLYAITRAMLEVMKVLTTVLFVVMFMSIAAAVSIPQGVIIGIIALIILTAVAGFVLMYKNK